MRDRITKWGRPVLFTLVGILGYYYMMDCSTRSCTITSGPIYPMIYIGLIRLLLSGVFWKGCEDEHDM